MGRVKKPGRPEKESSLKKHYKVDIRLNDGDMDMLNYLVAQTGKARTQIMRECLAEEFHRFISKNNDSL